MRSNKYLLGITALMAAGTFAVACSSGGGGSKTYVLDSGAYTEHTSSVNGDTCFASNIDVILTSFAIPFNISVTAGDLTLTATGAASAIIPPFSGTIANNDLQFGGSGNFVLSSNCALGFSTTATGTMTATDEFDTSIPLVVTANTTNGNPVNCSAFESGNLPGGLPIPFPTLTNGSSGTCQLTIVGHVAPTTP